MQRTRRPAARILQRHLRRRRLDAREDAGHGDGDRRAPASRPRRTCRASARPATASPRSWRPTANSGIRRIVALRGDLPSGTADRRRIPLCGRTGRASSARRRATTGMSKSRPIRNTTPASATRRATCSTMPTRSAPAPARRSRSSSSTPTPTSTSSTRRASSVPTCRSCRASCRSTTTRRSRSSRSATASRSRAGWR